MGSPLLIFGSFHDGGLFFFFWSARSSDPLLLLLLAAELLLRDSDEPVKTQGSKDVEDDEGPKNTGNKLANASISKGK